MIPARTTATSILLLLVTWGLLLPWLPGHALPVSPPAADDIEGQGQHEDRDYVYEDALTLMDNESPWMLLSNHSLPSPDDYKMKPRSVTRADFEQLLRQARTYRDVIRIFYDDPHLTDDDIDRIVTSQPRILSSSSNQQQWKTSSHRHHDLLNDTPMQHSSVEELEQAVEHVKEMDMVGDSACVPQPRLIHVRDLNLSATMAFFPECTLVHRCPGLGCCQRHDMHCVPSTTTIITRHFLTLVTSGSSRDHHEHVSPEGPYTLPLNFTNHTACHCQPMSLKPLPECLPCPKPYELSRHNVTKECQCHCSTDNKHCISIYKSIKPLDASELRCIKENRCARPTCLYGHFDDHSVANGYCPEKTATPLTNTSLSNLDLDPYDDLDWDDPSDEDYDYDSSGSLYNHEDYAY